jgi:chromate transporter
VRRVSLLRLVAVFTWTGLSSLGGGRSAYFHDALVRRRGFIRHDEFVQDFTLSQVLPGPNFSNLAVALGYRLAGVPGGVWGLLAIVLPGALILLGLGALYVRGAFSPTATLLMRGLSAAVVGLVLVTTLRIIFGSGRGLGSGRGRGALRGGRAIVVAALTFAAVGPLRLPTVGVVLVMAALSFWLQRSGPGPGKI